MKVSLAKTAGFCFGVQRAVDTVQRVLEQEMERPADERRKIYTYGAIVHNETVVRHFSELGVGIIDSEEELRKVRNAVVVIRAHGVGERIYEILNENGCETVDASCPFVRKIQQLVHDHTLAGEETFIVGSPDHPEIVGIVGWSRGKVTVIPDVETAEKMPDVDHKPVFIVSQTTFNYDKFKQVVDILKKKGYYVNVINTICNATLERQTEAKELAGSSDAMIVIGGSSSSNTKKLFEICRQQCRNTQLIQTVHDLKFDSDDAIRSVGITAGASTPKEIIEEVLTYLMSEMSFEQMLEGSLKSIHTGEIVTGKVIAVKPDEIALNIGYKSDGIMSRADYSADNSLDLTTAVQVGDEIECKVKKVNDGEGQVILSHRDVMQSKASEELRKAFENNETLTGKVVQVVKGGLNVEVNGARVFIPASLVSDTFERDLTKYQNQDIQFVIIEFNPTKRRVIGDRKQLLAAAKKEQHDKLFSELQVGDIRTGVVKNLTDFGAFIDLGGADGLLHISEMSWGRIESPKKLFKPGQEVKVMVKDISGERIALTRKFPDENPWKDAETKYAVGTVIHGKVARMTDFGAFIELDKGIDALLHVSQISKEHVNKPSDVLTVGQEIDAKVVDLDVENHKISLSMKALMNDRHEDADYADVDVEAVGRAEAEKAEDEDQQ